MTASEKFMGMMIVQGYYTFEQVMAKRPDMRQGITEYLITTGNGHLITGGN